MTVPPPASGPTSGDGAQRDYLGWVFLAVLFVLVIAGAVAGQKTNDKQGRLDEAESMLESLVQSGTVKSALLDQSGVTLKDIEDALGPDRIKEPHAAAIDSAARTYLGQPVDPQAIQVLRNGKSAASRNSAAILGSSKLTLADAQRLTAGLPDTEFTARLISAQAFQKAGDPRPLHNLGQAWLAKMGTVAGIIGLLGALSLAAWTYVIGEKLSGRIRPLGFKVALPTLYDADRLAIRAASLLVLFLVVGTTVEVAGAAVHHKPSESLTALLTSVLMLIVVPMLFRTQLLGRRLSLADIGVEPVQLGRMIRIGLLGFLLEIPIAMLLALLGSLIFSGLHPTHPATQELQSDHSPFAVFSLFFFGAVVAPFWEEIMFRGLLFPALSRVTGRVLMGAVISSFLFGAVHPQGLPLWMALMAVAGMSCALTYHTRSMVPSIVMHAAHNGVLLALTLLYS